MTDTPAAPTTPREEGVEAVCVTCGRYAPPEDRLNPTMHRRCYEQDAIEAEARASAPLDVPSHLEVKWCPAADAEWAGPCTCGLARLTTTDEGAHHD